MSKNVSNNNILSCTRVENNVGKAKNSCYQHFLLFPLCFQKNSSQVRLTLYQTSPGFYVSAIQAFCKHCGMSNFSFSHSVFNPFEELSYISIKFEIVVCKLFQFERV